MGRVISITNQKGGVGKTTTAINLSACLAEQGKEVLLIDLDPQGNSSTGLGLNKAKLKNTIYNVLLNELHISKIITKTKQKKLYIAPTNMDLAGSEIEFISINDREYLLKNIIETIKYSYDYIIIDCPPSLNILTLNALTASTSVLVPIQCEYYALEGLTQLIHTINLVKKKLNPTLYIEGIVFTMFDARTNLSLQVVEEVKKHLKEKTYKTIIPRNVRLGEAPSYGLPINLYDKTSKGAESYRLLAEEVINYK